MRSFNENLKLIIALIGSVWKGDADGLRLLTIHHFSPAAAKLTSENEQEQKWENYDWIWQGGENEAK